MITFNGIESGPVDFPGFLSLTPYLTIETIQEKTKNKTLKPLIGESKGRKVCRYSGAGNDG